MVDVVQKFISYKHFQVSFLLLDAFDGFLLLLKSQVATTKASRKGRQDDDDECLGLNV